jgi:hypothetical protein
MKCRWIVLGALLAIAMSPIPAAAQVILTFPSAEETRIFVSPDTVSTWTEVAAQDYLIPDSQVFITGRGSDGAKYLGLLGVAIARSQNESATGAAADRLRLSFSGELTRALKEAISSRPPTPKISVADNAGAALLTLLPSAKFTVADDNSARLSFRMTVRFVDAITHSEVKKEYYYYHGGGRNLAGPDGWSDDNASAVRKSSEEAMTRLAEVLLDDLAGAFSSAYDPAKARFANYSVVGFEGKPARALLLEEYPDHLALAPLLRDRPSRGVVVILERRSIVLQPM